MCTEHQMEDELRIALVHTPMSSLYVEGRDAFWRNFDIRYHAVHPNARHMKKFLWELPHWMLWLGGVLEHEGFNSLNVLDFYTDCGTHGGIHEENIKQQLRSQPADIYLFSPMTPNLHHALRIAEMAKELNSDAVTIFGGVVATPLQRELSHNKVVDYIIRDSGEYALPLLLRAIEGRVDLQSIGNLSFRDKNKQVIVNAKQFSPMRLEDLPFPKLDLFSPSTGENIRYIRQVHTVGCPYQCPYCSDLMIGRKPFSFAIGRTLAEIRAYRAYYGEHHHIYFGDETFTLNTQRTLSLCEALRSEGNIEYDCQTRLNCLVDDRLPKALALSGCRWLEIGLESLNQHALDLVKQRTKVGDLEVILKSMRDNGVAVCTNLLLGLPYETVDDMKRSIEGICSLIEKGLLHASYVFQLVPYPGTEMYRHPDKFGIKILHHDYSLYNEDLLPIFDTKHVSSEELYRVFLEAIQQVGQVMTASKNQLGAQINLRSDEFGNFWHAAHP